MTIIRKPICKLLELKENATWDEIYSRYKKASRRVLLIALIFVAFAYIITISFGELVCQAFDNGLMTIGVDSDSLISFEIIAAFITNIGVITFFSLAGWAMIGILFDLIASSERKKEKKIIKKEP